MAQRADISVSLLSSTATPIVINAGGANYLGFGTNATERARITNGGNVGIGTSTPEEYGGYRALTISDSVGAQIYWKSTNSSITAYAGVDSTGAYLATFTNTDLLFRTNNTERARITSGGDLLVGTTSATVSATSSAKAMAGNFRSLYASVTISASSTATLLTLSSSVTGVYIINANFGGQGNQIYGGMLTVVANAGSFRIVTDGSGSNCSLTLSGANVQITNALGVPLDAIATAILIGN